MVSCSRTLGFLGSCNDTSSETSACSNTVHTSAQNSLNHKSVRVNDYCDNISRAVMPHVVSERQQQVVKNRVVYNSSVDKQKCEGPLARGNQVKPPIC